MFKVSPRHMEIAFLEGVLGEPMPMLEASWESSTSGDVGVEPAIPGLYPSLSVVSTVPHVTGVAGVPGIGISGFKSYKL